MSRDRAQLCCSRVCGGCSTGGATDVFNCPRRHVLLHGSATSSARLYWESFGSFGGGNKVPVPTGVARFPKEILRPPRHWCENNYNITRWTDMPRGGHFAAFEQPELFVEDVAGFFADFR